MNLWGLLFIATLYLSAYFWTRSKDIKHFFLLTGIVTIPFETTYSFYTWQFHNGWISGIEISLSELSFLALFSIALWRGKRPFNGSRPIVWAMVLFVVASGLSGINSEVRKLTACQMVLVAKLFVLYYCGFVNSLDCRGDVRSVLNYLCVSITLQGAFCLLLYLTGLNFNAILSTGHWHRGLIMAGEDQEFIRAVGSFPQPNGLAAYLVPLLLLQAAVLFGVGERSRTRVLAMAAGLFALFASFSSAGWLGFFLCFPLLMVVLGRLRVVSAVALLIGMVGVALSIGPVRERVMGDDRNSAASRIPLMHLAMNMIKAHPIIGVGANTYSMAKYKYLDASLDGAWLDQVHNMYLLVLAETGSLGLGAFLMFLLFFSMEAGACIRRYWDPFTRAIGVGVRFGLIASMIHMFVDMFHARALLSSMFMLCGLVTALKQDSMLQDCSVEEDQISGCEASGEALLNTRLEPAR